MSFDRVAILDWSAARGRRQGKDSIWLGLADAGGVTAENLPTRGAAEARLAAVLAEPGKGRTLLGADFAFGWPQGLAQRVAGRDGALALWDWLAARVREHPGHSSNYRIIAAEMNGACGGGAPFWGNGEQVETPGLPRRRPAVPPGLAPFRRVETVARAAGANPKSVWQLAGAGAVGAQALTGVPVLHGLRAAQQGKVAVWPFEPWEHADVVLAEVYPSLLAGAVRAGLGAGAVPDQVQVRVLAQALFRLAQDGRLAAMLRPDAPPEVLAEEGWILGVGFEDLLRAAAPQAQAETLRPDQPRRIR